MYRLNGITDEAYQQHIIPWQNETWFSILDTYQLHNHGLLTSNTKSKMRGQLATLGALMFESSPFPFRVQIIDKLGSGLDPFEKNDFINRIEIRFMDLDEAEKVRGY